MDSYIKLRVIGKGSYGEVWLVKHKKDRKQYVLKRMEISTASRRERKAAEQEAKLLAKLKHPNICSYKDSFETDNGMLYIAMGYCEGGDLYTRLKEQKNVPLEESQVVEWFVQIAMALQYMHERNILHRDLKTQNIFLTKSKIIKVGDLGIARVLDNSNDMATTLIGTPYYMGPELFSNKPYNHKSDVWALGCCVYEMATLKHAFNARDMNSLVYKILRGKMPPMPRQYSPELVTLIKAMLNSKPERRPSVNRILRDPYIKKNIAIFLESTRKHGSNRSANSNNRVTESQSARSHSDARRRNSEDVPDSARSSASSVNRAYNKVSVKSQSSVDESLEPLEVGPDLEPIMEEATPRASSENLLGSGDSRMPGTPNRSRSNTPTRSRPPTPSKPHSHSEPRNLPPSGCDNVSRHALKKKKPRYKREAELNHVNSSSGVDRGERGSSPHRMHSPQRAPSPHDEHKQAKNNSVFNNAKPVEKPRPLPPRPAAMSQEPSASSAVPKRSQSRKAAMSEKEESGYGSISSSVNSSKDDNPGREEDTPRQSVNLSARARRREKKGTETPRTSRSVDIQPRSERVRPKSGGVSRSADYPSSVPDSPPKARPRSANVDHPKRSSIDSGRIPRQPSINEESSDSETEDIVVPEKADKDQQRRTHIVISESHSAISRRHSSPAIQTEDSVDGLIKDADLDSTENEEYRKEKEMNNFISLLNHTLQMNRGSGGAHSKGSSSSDEEDTVDGVIPEVPEVEAEADKEGQQEIVVSEFDYEPIRRPDPARPHAPVKTLGTSTRLMDRITVLRKDCIRALGVEKMKRAYDILDEVDGDAIEDELVRVLGRNDFDVYAGKIWQLKFCEEAAFGII